jgi:malonyl-CoA O-methyltransferase
MRVRRSDRSLTVAVPGEDPSQNRDREGAVRVSAREGYALWADTCDSTRSPIVALSDRIVQPWIEALGGHRRIIDVGAGTGRWTGRLGAIGLDLSWEMLAVAGAKPGLGGRLAVADAMKLPIATGSADLVLCTLVLGYARDPLAAWRELARVVKPGGSLILTDFHPEAAAYGWRRTFRANGQVYEIENHSYTLNQLTGEGLALREHRDAVFEEPERELFERAGKLFETARHTPAVLAAWWMRV